MADDKAKGTGIRFNHVLAIYKPSAMLKDCYLEMWVGLKRPLTESEKANIEKCKNFTETTGIIKNVVGGMIPALTVSEVVLSSIEDVYFVIVPDGKIQHVTFPK